MSIPSCCKCHCERVIKNGFVKGKQRWLCKGCGLNFSRTEPLGKPESIKSLAILLYSLGLSFRAAGLVVSVSRQTVMTWVSQYVDGLKLPRVEGMIELIELDEMWHFIKKKQTKSGSGRPLILLQVGNSTSKWVAVTPKL